MRRNRIYALIVAAVMVALLVSACDGGTLPTTSAPGDGATTTTTAAETTTTADDTNTTAPEAAAPEDASGSDEETPWWILLIVGLAFLVIIIALVTRGSGGKTAASTPSPTTWKDHARNGYADARWLYDGMSEDVAIWRGNAQFDGATGVGDAAASGRAETWHAIQGRLSAASDALYQLEATAPDARSADSARSTIAAMRATREALDARAEARFAYRKAEAANATPQDLGDARDREVRASRNLSESRNAFAKALTDLSALM